MGWIKNNSYYKWEYPSNENNKEAESIYNEYIQKVKEDNISSLEEKDILIPIFSKNKFNIDEYNIILKRRNDLAIKSILLNYEFNYTGSITDTLDFTSVIFLKKVSFLEVEFKEEVNFIYALFLNSVDFSGAVFYEKTQFTGAIFTQNVDYFSSKFLKITYFSKTVFKKELNMSLTEFKDEVLFFGSLINVLFFINVSVFSFFNLADTNINKLILGKVSFNNKKILVENLNSYFKNIIPSNTTNYNSFRRTCSLLKTTYQNQKNFIDSNIWYALEMKAFEKELGESKNNNFGQKVVFKFNAITSNHGQSVGIPILFILGTTVVYLLVNWLCPLLDITSRDWNDAFEIMFPIKDIFNFAKEASNINNVTDGLRILTITMLKIFTGVMYWTIYRAIRQNSKRGF